MLDQLESRHWDEKRAPLEDFEDHLPARMILAAFDVLVCSRLHAGSGKHVVHTCVAAAVMLLGLVAAACAARPAPEIAGEPVVSNAPANLDGWVGSYRREFRGYSCGAEVFKWRSQYVGRVETSGIQVSSDLLCHVELDGPDRLRLIFQHPGANPGMQNTDYAPGQVVLTLVRSQGGVQIEPGALVPHEEPEPPRPKTIKDLSSLDQMYAHEFLGVEEVSRRLDRLLGGDRGLFDRAVALQRPGSRDGDTVFLAGGEPHGGARRAGVVYDARHDEITAFTADPECRERLDVWSENWGRVAPKTLDWIKQEGGGALPVRRHQP